MAIKTNIAVPRGSSVRLTFSNKPAGELPGSTTKFTVARAANSSTKIIPSKSCSTPTSDGVYHVDLSASDTNVAPGEYFWDTRVVTSGAETLLGYGVFTVLPIAQLPSAS